MERSLKTPVVAIIGGKKSGKTSAMQALIREFSCRGYRVAAVKHISEEDFTIDTVNKDTWKFAKAGAKTVVSVASHEIATIEKIEACNITIDGIRKKCAGSDVILIEGFRSLVGRRLDIPKIVAVKSAEEVSVALENFKPIIAFTGPYNASSIASNLLYIDVLKEGGKIADLVENFLLEKGAFRRRL